MKIIEPGKPGDERDVPRSKLGFRFSKRDTSTSKKSSEHTAVSDRARDKVKAVPSRIEIKLLVLGDHIRDFGLKNSLLNVYTKQRTDLDYIFAYDESDVYQTIGAHDIKYRLCTTAGMEAFDRLRQGMYPNTNVILMLFHYNDRMSFVNATSQWLDEIKEHLPNVPVVLVGVKDECIPTPPDPGSVVRPDEATNIAKEKGFDVFVECSLNDLSSVNNAFNHALLSALLSDKSTKESAEKVFSEYSQLSNEFNLVYFNTFASKVFKPLSYSEQKSRNMHQPAQPGLNSQPVERSSRFGGLFGKRKGTNSNASHEAQSPRAHPQEKVEADLPPSSPVDDSKSATGEAKLF